MGEKSLKWFVQSRVLLALILTACNIFNPSGEGDLPDSIEGKISVGQTLLQSGDYQGAMDAFQEAIEADSNNSFAYYSYAKAARFKHNLNGLELSKELTGIDENSTSVPFLTTPASTLNGYLQATTVLKPVLEVLITRDSLTRWFYDYDDPTKNSPDDIARRAIMDKYWADGANGVSGTHPKSDFPLTDRVIEYEKVTPDMALVLVVHVFSSLKDLNGDGVIDERDNVELVEDVLALLEGDGEVTLEDIGALIEDDETAKDVNDIIDKFSEGTGDITAIAEIMGDFAPAGEDSTSGDLTEDITATMDALGNSIVFYKYNDSLDNDGDGCVDEEAWDGVDNDGDGYTDEDVNTFNVYVPIPGESTATTRTDSSYKDFANLQNSGTDVTVSQSDLLAGTQGGVIDFQDANFWIAYSNGEDRDLSRFNMLDIVAAAEDTIPPYYGLSAGDIQKGKTTIGGCWNMY